MYRPVTRDWLSTTLHHLRELFRKAPQRRRGDEYAHEAREIFTRNLLTNLSHLGDHVMPTLVAEAAHAFHLTAEGAHCLFGYNLSHVRQRELVLNSSRTRLIESYPFQRDLAIELPAKLGPDDAFLRTSSLREIVSNWQEALPIRSLRGPNWIRTGTVYAQVGTADSLGSRLPPGAIAAVVPIDDAERRHPSARAIYLLQFSRGYLFCGCSVDGQRLTLSISDPTYDGPDEFEYPKDVRLVGRVSNFALSLPQRLARSQPLPSSGSGAPLLLPWQHQTLSGLLAAKSRRFRRSASEMQRVHDLVERELRRGISARTERRYRKDTTSIPHVNALIEMSLLRMARYSDILSALSIFPSDEGGYSLDALLRVTSLNDLPEAEATVDPPEPESRWRQILGEWGEWSTLLSMTFPEIQPLEGRMMRLNQSTVFNGMDPLIPTGSLLLLEEEHKKFEIGSGYRKPDWERPIYLVTRGDQTFCGYVEVESNRYIVLPHAHSNGQRLAFRREEVTRIRKVVGVAIPMMSRN